TLWLLGALPVGAQAAFATLTARAARRLDRRHSDAAREFLTQAFGAKLSAEERERRVLDTWKFFFTMLARTGRLDREVQRGGFDAHFERVYGPGVEEALAKRRGLIVVTPHLGDFEAGAFAMPRLGFSPVYVVSRPPRNRYLSITAQRQRDARGFRLLHRHGAMEDVSKILQAGGTLVMMLDQRARKRTVVAPFFGRPAHCERAPGILMRRLAVPVLVGWVEALERPWHYRVHMQRVFEPQEFARSSPEEVATALNRAMEEMILSAPGQYFWLHDRYRKAPPAS
ncbi:MAG TPA: lysophospholipid acyltransferase family protein, partial [Planctomycetota bacterium]|nr:lysophospholipid acyltransferase family protein [Planctomycetota bacterium]